MRTLDLPDIQGNIHRPYGRFGFPYARYFLFHIKRDQGGAGRWFVDQIRPFVTTAEPWARDSAPDGAAHGTGHRAAPGTGPKPKPPLTVNIGFTWDGLLALDLPILTLQQLPEEFIQGMASRRHLLGDIGASAPEEWDPVWRDANKPDGEAIHIWVSFNAQGKRGDGTPVEELDLWTDWLLGLTENEHARGKVVVMTGHDRAGTARWQDSNTLMRRHPDTGRLEPTPYEHFGFMDGISDPVFEDQGILQDDPNAAVGSGKLLPGPFDPVKSWQPLATGEFILGHASEGQELPPSAAPARFMRNGTFMAVRKLHQNTGTFANAIEAHAQAYQRVANLETIEAARETLRAKMVGRWSSGVPLMVAPMYKDMLAVLARFPLLQKQQCGQTLTEEEARQAKRQLRDFERMLTDYRYVGDPEGVKCPLGAHVRRANPRDMMDPNPATSSSTLTNRRRILRRGLPYGERSLNDDDEHGVFIMALCANLFRQFEFIQQQWMQYRLDMESGNDTCPIIGNRDQSAKFVVPADPAGNAMPYIASNLPQFVKTRGGGYFFIPSLTALRMIAMGEIDPT